MIESFAYAYSLATPALFHDMAFSASYAHGLSAGLVGHNNKSLSRREMIILERLRALVKDSNNRKTIESPQIFNTLARQGSRLRASGRLSSLVHLKLVKTDLGTWKLIIIRRFTKPRIGRTPAKFVYKSCSSRTSRSSFSSLKNSITPRISECDDSTSHTTCDTCDHTSDLHVVEHAGQKRKHESNNQLNSTYTHQPQDSFSTTSSTFGYPQQPRHDGAPTAEPDAAFGSSKKPKHFLEDPLHCPPIGDGTIPCCGREGHTACRNRRTSFRGHQTYSHVSGHLNKCHNLLFCLMCWKVFESASNYRSHIQNPCIGQPLPADFRTGWPAELLEHQNCHQLLRCMTEYADLVGNGSTLTDEEKWEKTWTLLHPGCEHMVPNCYFSIGTPSTTTTTDIVSMPDQQLRTFPMAPPMAPPMRRRNLSAPLRPPDSQQMSRSMTTPNWFNSSRSDSGGWLPGTATHLRNAFASNTVATTGEMNPNQWSVSMEDPNLNGQTTSQMLQDVSQNVLAFVNASENQQVPGTPLDTHQAQQRIALSRSGSSRLDDIAEHPMPSQTGSESVTSQQPETDDLLSIFRHQQRDHQQAQQQMQEQRLHNQRLQEQQQIQRFQEHQRQQHLTQQLPPNHFTSSAPQMPYFQGRSDSSPQNHHAYHRGLPHRPGPPRDRASIILARVRATVRRLREDNDVQELQHWINDISDLPQEDLRNLVSSLILQLENLDNIARSNT